jgi:hypothetical protein
MTTTINPEGKTPWEVYGLAEERMRELANRISELLHAHFFDRMISRATMLAEMHSLAKTDNELLYVHFSIGSGMSKCIQLKEQQMLTALMEKKISQKPAGGIAIPFGKTGQA